MLLWHSLYPPVLFEGRIKCTAEINISLGRKIKKAKKTQHTESLLTVCVKSSFSIALLSAVKPNRICK